MPTHVTGTLEHAGGAVSTVLLSFDVQAAQLPRIEIYGHDGTLFVPDPNHFDGPVQLFHKDSRKWTSMPAAAGYPDTGRSCGLADLAGALESGTAHRASGELALHVLDIMESLLRSAKTGRAEQLTTNRTRPSPVPLGG